MVDWSALTARIDQAVAERQWQVLAEVDTICREALLQNRQQTAALVGSDNSLTADLRAQKEAELHALTRLQAAYHQALDCLQAEQKDLQNQMQSLRIGRQAGAAYLAIP